MNSREQGREFGRAARQGRDTASLVFVHLAQTEQFDDVTMLEHFELFPTWTEHFTGVRNTIVQDDGLLYRSLHDIGPGQNVKPSVNVGSSGVGSLWKRIGNPLEEWPEWSQPIGTLDAYTLGAKVSHNGKRWICTGVGGDGVWNVWEPGVYGWSEQ